MIPPHIQQFCDSMRIRIIDTHGNSNTICIIIKSSKDKVLPILDLDNVQGMVSTVQEEYHYVFVTPY